MRRQNQQQLYHAFTNFESFFGGLCESSAIGFSGTEARKIDSPMSRSHLSRPSFVNADIPMKRKMSHFGC
jgi:hypothetical protein